MKAILDKLKAELNEQNSAPAVQAPEAPIQKPKKAYTYGGDIYCNATKKIDMKTNAGRLQVMSNMGIDCTQLGVTPDEQVLKNRAERIEKDSLKRLETNANEVMHTTNTGFGEELVPAEVLMADVLLLVNDLQKKSFVGSLPGFHGSGLDKTVKRAIIGDAGLMKSSAERTSAAANLGQANRQVGTDEVTITQKQFDLQIDVSSYLNSFSVMGAAGLESMIKNQLARSWDRTVEANIINADTETGGTGNVNRDDAAPSSGHVSYDTYLQFDGLRKTAIVTDTNTLDVSTFAFTDFIATMNKIPFYAVNPEDCIWLFNFATYIKALGLDEFIDASKNAKGSTIFSGALTNILGSDLFTSRDMPKTEADGKVSNTAGNNTLGQFLYFWKPAVQYGFGKGLEIMVHNRGSLGYQADAWGFMGMDIVGNTETANLSEKTVAAGIDVTL